MPESVPATSVTALGRRVDFFLLDLCERRFSALVFQSSSWHGGRADRSAICRR